jgi:hypothetical protein
MIMTILMWPTLSETCINLYSQDMSLPCIWSPQETLKDHRFRVNIYIKTAVAYPREFFKEEIYQMVHL